jgi:cell division protein FtsW
MPPVYSRKSDRVLGLLVFGLVLFGVIMVYSASVVVSYNLFGDSRFFFKKQLIAAVLGIIAMLVVSNIDYRIWKRYATGMLLATLILLLSVFFFSKGEINGAHRWIVIGGQSFQPSELAKLTFVLYASAWLVQRAKAVADIRTTFLPYLAVLGLLSFLLLKQPDFGTLSIFLVSAFAVYFAAGLTLKQFGYGVAILVLFVSLTISFNPYMKDRLATFLNPRQGGDTTSYHVQNIAIAVGNGGWLGQGFGESNQKRRFLPEPQTDSIFAIVVEELGYVVAQLLILCYLVIVLRCYRIAALTTDLFGRLVAVGIASWLGFQVVINIGSMLHLVPLVGVPLPFLSFGGTNLLISLTAVGVLLNISRNIKEENG